MRHTPIPHFTWLLLASLGGIACTDDGNDPVPETEISASATNTQDHDGGPSNSKGEDVDGSKPANSSDAGDPVSDTTLFGVGTLTFGENNSSNGYLLLVPDIDRNGAEFDMEGGREFAGQSDFATHEGAIMVASGDEPSITKFEVDTNGDLEAGATLSFTSYGITSAAFWNNQFVAEDKAYMMNGPTEIIIWNPNTMELEGTIELPAQEKRDGLKVVVGLADRSSLVHDGKFYIPVYWTDDSYAERSDDSVIIVVDIENDEVVSTIAAECPGLDYATVDDSGNLHFSNWTGGVGTYYVLGTAQNCIATVDPESEEVTTKSFASITGGHEGAAFKYAGNGQFVMSVFDEERADIENAEDPFTPIGGTHWQLWSYDPESGAAAPIESIDWNSGAIIHNWAGGSLYSMVPGADYATTKVYKLLDGEDAERAFDITGWSFRLLDLGANR